MADAPYTGLVYEPDGDDSSVSSSGIGRLDAADPGVEFPAEIAWLTDGQAVVDYADSLDGSGDLNAAIWRVSYGDSA